jgi:RNA polymerase sigma-70 factor (ECF subfamily)
VLCGFGIEEIAHALLTEKETIQKRLTRAKEKLRQANVSMEMPAEKDITARLEPVLKTIYLLFNEGYYSETNDAIIREDLCTEAMNLAYMLLEYPTTNKPETNALMALMCFHSSRIPARKSIHGDIILYEDQDSSSWNNELIARGAKYLHVATGGDRLSTYHLEASIAYWHTRKEDSPEKWEAILQLYNRLLQLDYSPIAALNRTYALAKANGYEKAIEQAEKLKLLTNPYYFSLLAELYKNIDPAKALLNLQMAASMSKTDAEKQLMNKRLEALKAAK